jgi:hypothetical protein
MVDGGWLDGWMMDGGWADGGWRIKKKVEAGPGYIGEVPSTVPQSDRNGIPRQTKTHQTARQAVWSAFHVEQHLYRPSHHPSSRFGVNGSVVHQHREHTNTQDTSPNIPQLQRTSHRVICSSTLHQNTAAEITTSTTTTNRNHDHHHHTPHFIASTVFT